MSSLGNDGGGFATPDASVDVYSYGILLYALITCEEPYRELRRAEPQALLALVMDGYRPLSHLMQVADAQVGTGTATATVAATADGAPSERGAEESEKSNRGGSGGDFSSGGNSGGGSSGGILLSNSSSNRTVSRPINSKKQSYSSSALLSSTTPSFSSLNRALSRSTTSSSSGYETLSSRVKQAQVPLLGSPHERLAAAAKAASNGRDVSPVLLDLMVRPSLLSIVGGVCCPFPYLQIPSLFTVVLSFCLSISCVLLVLPSAQRHIYFQIRVCCQSICGFFLTFFLLCLGLFEYEPTKVRCWGEAHLRPSFGDIVTELRTYIGERERSRPPSTSPSLQARGGGGGGGGAYPNGSSGLRKTHSMGTHSSSNYSNNASCSGNRQRSNTKERSALLLRSALQYPDDQHARPHRHHSAASDDDDDLRSRSSSVGSLSDVGARNWPPSLTNFPSMPALAARANVGKYSSSSSGNNTRVNIGSSSSSGSASSGGILGGNSGNQRVSSSSASSTGYSPLHNPRTMSTPNATFVPSSSSSSRLPPLRTASPQPTSADAGAATAGIATAATTATANGDHTRSSGVDTDGGGDGIVRSTTPDGALLGFFEQRSRSSLSNKGGSDGDGGDGAQHSLLPAISKVLEGFSCGHASFVNIAVQLFFLILHIYLKRKNGRRNE